MKAPRNPGDFAAEVRFLLSQGVHPHLIAQEFGTKPSPIERKANRWHWDDINQAFNEAKRWQPNGNITRNRNNTQNRRAA